MQTSRITLNLNHRALDLLIQSMEDTQGPKLKHCMHKSNLRICSPFPQVQRFLDVMGVLQQSLNTTGGPNPGPLPAQVTVLNDP